MSPTGAERWARRLLVAYPWRVRVEQGDEIVATVLDVLPPGAHRMPWRDQVDLVRGGLQARARRRMSPWAHLRYAVGLRVDDRWLPWVVDDLEAPGFRRRLALRTAFHLSLLVPFFSIGGGWTWAWSAGMIGLGTAGSVLRADASRRLIAARHHLERPPPAADLVWVRMPARSTLPDLAVAPLLAAVALPLALGAGALVVAGATSVPAPGWLGPATEPAAPGDLLAACLPPALIGLGLGAVLLAALATAGRRPRADPRALSASSPIPVSAAQSSGVGTRVACALVAGALALGAGVRVLLLWAQQAPWELAPVAAAVGPAALGLLAGAGLLARTGRRRGRSVGLWDLVPAVAPRPKVVAVARWAVHLVPGAEVLPDGHPGATPWRPRLTGGGRP